VERRTPLWLSHHYPDEYDRCVTIGHTNVCRRCSVFWPACFAATLFALVGVRWPEGLDPWLLWLLPVPVVVEWWLERLRLVAYSPWRNTVFSLVCAPAVGVGLARYLLEPSDGLFWTVVAVYAVVCLVPVFLSRISAVRIRADRFGAGRRPTSAESATRRAAGSAR
jgi:hypothetical protein